MLGELGGLERAKRLRNMSDFCLGFPALPACVATKEQVWSERVVVFLCLCVCVSACVRCLP